MPGPTVSDPYNREILENNYLLWKKDPHSVDESLQAFFAGVEFSGNGVAHNHSSRNGTVSSASTSSSANMTVETRLQTGVVRLVTGYRDLGHLVAHIDPLSESAPPTPWILANERFNVRDSDMNEYVDASMFFGLSDREKLGDVLDALRETYGRTLGVEYMHIQDHGPRRWLAETMELCRNRPTLNLSDKYRILMTLHWATMFESFLHRKYVGQKRFSLEGGETLLPILDAIVERSPSLGAKEIVIGMAHRGRLNVLANIMQKPLEEIFREFEDNYLPDTTKDGDGDVKYHLGFSADVTTTNGETVHVSLTANPSHLEAVNPVVEGRVRAKQRIHNDTERTAGVPLLIHGDAAFAGQGVVAETLNLANLAGYRTGGTIHIVVNNQIGFTTHPRDARSTQYCSDLAKFIQAPIFHVNAEDPEACVHVANLALEYRQKFHSDVVIDMVCYRKYGHNEGDEPSYTQPVEYSIIENKIGIAATYTKQLVERQDIKSEEAEAIDAEFRHRLESALKEARDNPPRRKGMRGFAGAWSNLTNQFSHDPVATLISEATADRIADQLLVVPNGFTIHPKLVDILKKRQDAIKNRSQIDWGTAEALTYGSLTLEGIMVRLSGQDSRRGTFSHRHAFVFDYHTGKGHCPINEMDPNQAPYLVYDSSLSEAAVLGFEYGFSLDAPDALVMWEAQFGDFVNGAQVIIDQFITSGESKWNRASGLVMLLPHGYEGQGPEHSSARLERFLQACAEDNIQVCNFTTPAQFFHAMRRQVKRTFRKPLIVMTPKSLLRTSLSPMADLLEDRFHEVIDDPKVDPEKVTRILLCSGKVYFEMVNEREKAERDDVAIIRIEQLYPWPEMQLKAILARYPKAEVRWLQEESQNMGAWFFVEPRLREMGYDVRVIARDASASTATGSHYVHKHEQAELLEAALNEPGPYLVAGARTRQS